MLSQFPTWFFFVAALLGCGCIGTLMYLARDNERRLRSLGEDNDRKLEEHDQTFVQLESRVEDMAGRLFNAATERRELSRANQKLSSDIKGWVGELKTARDGMAVQEHEIARLRDLEREFGDRLRVHRNAADEKDQAISALQAETTGQKRQLESLDRLRSEVEAQQREHVERVRIQRTALEDKDQTIAELQADLAGRTRLLEDVDRRNTELEERAQRQYESHGTLSARVAELEATLLVRDRALQESALDLKATAQSRQELAARVEEQSGELVALHRRTAELEAAGAARAGEYERELAAREQEAREHAATIESLRRASTELEVRAQSYQERCAELDGLAGEHDRMRREATAARERCEALERQIAQQTEQALEKERDERERERGWAARASELEADLGRRETAWRERSASFEALQREIDAKVRDLATAHERCSDLERQVEHDEERARGVQETQTALCQRVSELEGDVSKRDAECAEHAENATRLEQELAAANGELESARTRCRDLDLELRTLLDEAQERRRRELEVEASQRDRAVEFDGMMQEREGQMEELRVERTLLSARCAAVTTELEAAREELRDRERRLADADLRLAASKLELDRVLETSELDRAPIDPLVEGRILPLFKRGGVVGAELDAEGYLNGLDQGDLDLALRCLFGGAEPLSSPAMASLAGRWLQERNVWKQARFAQQAVYLWADGIYAKAGLREENHALLVVFAAFVDGTRSVVAVETGDRASKTDWLSILRDLERRGLGIPRLVVADEHLGIFEALDDLGWNSARQRCWSRRMDEVVALLPKNRQAWAAEQLRNLANAESRAEAKDLRDRFVKRCGVRNAAAAERLCEDWRQMTSFYAFPKSHWPHLRTTNVVESPFVAIRLRSATSRPCPTTADTESMLWKLLLVGENTFRKLNAPQLLQEVARGDAFVDGVPDERSRVRAA